MDSGLLRLRLRLPPGGVMSGGTVVFEPRDGMYRLVVNGKPLEGEPGQPLRFETAAEAERVRDSREQLFGGRR
ncbi:hypothetical protein [Streptacidiphilus fuscans]|uniref:Uncharacterized protein n=1 Tax=Streptacidiphilus fuscans TaxID=2789292 RepID=A0A931B6Z0_9ACTN|nr:hypothetical protein [Streptacidiphilus fuscans]MBF9068993.1 hypothetical protein [Streptacidiphilus fuscans]